MKCVLRNAWHWDKAIFWVLGWLGGVLFNCHIAAHLLRTQIHTAALNAFVFIRRGWDNLYLTVTLRSPPRSWETSCRNQDPWRTPRHSSHRHTNTVISFSAPTLSLSLVHLVLGEPRQVFSNNSTTSYTNEDRNLSIDYCTAVLFRKSKVLCKGNTLYEKFKCQNCYVFVKAKT